MKASNFQTANNIEIQEIEIPQIQKDTDAIIKVVRACVCGSDLWFYRGIHDFGKGVVGHEAIGIVSEVGSAVSKIKVGDFVIVPFTHGCGECPACKNGFEANCVLHANGEPTGYQAEYLRTINADGTLVKIPGQPSDYSQDQLASLTTLADVMPTGYHAAYVAGVKTGDTVVVMGDGAVGLCGVIAAKLLGAEKIIAMSRHEDRQKLAKEFGATDIVAERGIEGVAKVMELTNSVGADAVLECVGSELAFETAVNVVRAGGMIGRVGLPTETDYNKYIDALFWKNAGLKGGAASVHKYDTESLLEKVLDGSINPGKVFTQTYKLEDIKQAYDDMDQRKTIKSLLIVSEG